MPSAQPSYGDTDVDIDIDTDVDIDRPNARPIRIGPFRRRSLTSISVAPHRFSRFPQSSQACLRVLTIPPPALVRVPLVVPTLLSPLRPAPRASPVGVKEGIIPVETPGPSAPHGQSPRPPVSRASRAWGRKAAGCSSTPSRRRAVGPILSRSAPADDHGARRTPATVTPPPAASDAS